MRLDRADSSSPAEYGLNDAQGIPDCIGDFEMDVAGEDVTLTHSIGASLARGNLIA